MSDRAPLWLHGADVRQLLNLFKIMDLYNRMISDSNFDVHPASFIFSGKAAENYVFAKDVIRLVNSVADVVNNDPRVRGRRDRATPAPSAARTWLESS